MGLTKNTNTKRDTRSVEQLEDVSRNQSSTNRMMMILMMRMMTITMRKNIIAFKRMTMTMMDMLVLWWF
jgi:hypothetical protein